MLRFYSLGPISVLHEAFLRGKQNLDIWRPANFLVFLRKDTYLQARALSRHCKIGRLLAYVGQGVKNPIAVVHAFLLWDDWI